MINCLKIYSMKKLSILFLSFLIYNSCDSIRVSSDFNENTNFSELKTYAFSKTGIDKSDVQEVLEATLITIKESLVEGESVFIRGFGTFSNKKRAKKIARNISTNTAIILEAHFVPHFKPSKIFVDLVKKNNQIA